MRLPILALTLAVPLMAPLTAPLSAQEAFTWVYDAELNFYPSDSRLNLVATQEGAPPAGPGSDLPSGLIWGSCLTEFDSGAIALRFETFLGAEQQGDFVEFALSGSSGASFNVTGQVINRGNDPVGGVEIMVQAGGPEMQMLESSDIVTYGVSRYTDFIYDFDLSTNRAYVAEFNADCAGVAAGGALQRGPINAPPALGTPTTNLIPDIGPAISGHVWQRYSDIRQDVFETSLTLVYGVPETDDVAVIGECFIGAQGPLVSFQVSADIDGLFETQAATLRVIAGDGRQIDVGGSVIGTQAEFGVSGIDLVLDPSDPALLVIAGDETLRFERVGAPNGFTLTGNGPSTIGPFLADCAEIDRLTPGGTPPPSAPIGAQPGNLACDSFGRVSSFETGQPTAITFTNASNGYRGLVWIDPNGTPIDQGGMNQGDSLSFTSDPGHFWMITDGPGNCMEMVQPVAGQTQYNLTVRN